MVPERGLSKSKKLEHISEVNALYTEVTLEPMLGNFQFSWWKDHQGFQLDNQIKVFSEEIFQLRRHMHLKVLILQEIKPRLFIDNTIASRNCNKMPFLFSRLST